MEWKEKEVFPGKWHGFSTYTTYQGIEYDFNSENFDEESAKELIGKISDFISYTDSFFDSPTQDLTIYLGFQSDNSASFRTPLCITDGKVLIFDDLWCLVKKTHPGNPSCAEQYGLFFAYCIDNGILSYDNSDTHTNELQSFYSDKDHLYLLDFTLPMLETTYFSQEDSAIEKESVAIRLTPNLEKLILAIIILTTKKPPVPTESNPTMPSGYGTMQMLLQSVTLIW